MQLGWHRQPKEQDLIVVNRHPRFMLHQFKMDIVMIILIALDFALLLGVFAFEDD